MRKNGHKGMWPFPAGRFMSPSAVSATPVVAPHSAFYCGASMSGVFRPGDSLRLEARQKLAKIRPETLGQAARISGVSPGDISVLMVWLEKKRREETR